ncbi:MAG: UDP-3-O-acyl-N-acetylglucosamine deacetylase [Robiginitomaculum sp.]
MRSNLSHIVQRQATLKGPAICSGVGLHSGERIKLVMRPAPIGTGIVFIRTDIADRDNVIAAIPQNVTNVRNCTTIGNAASVTVATIEHLMAALAAAGIDNLYVDIDGPELPALDGSAEPFLKLIEQVGITRQAAPRRYIKVLKRVEVRLPLNEGGAIAVVEPHHCLCLDVSIDFAEAAIGQQNVVIEPNVRTFRERLAASRTFARLHEVAALQDAGLSQGGSLDNVVVVDGDKVINPGGLRFDDEFVRHKALDLLGDLYVGGPLLGKVTTSKSGHALNHALLTALFSDPQAWRFAVMSDSAAGDAGHNYDQFVTHPTASILEDATA